MRLKVVPCTQQNAKRFVNAHHRHHSAKISAIFCVAVVDESNSVRGVAMCGWPVARRYSDGFTIEVNRVATDGCGNACSALLGACRRIAFELGYRRIITYTLHEEGGGSLRGAGWKLDSTSAGGASSNWHTRKGRSIDMKQEQKCRWISVNARALSGDVMWPEDDHDAGQLNMFEAAAQ